MKADMKGFLRFIGIMSLAVTLFGCGPFASTVVQLNRENYVPKIDATQYSQYQGKRLLLSTIIDESKNTENLAYYNPQRTVGYALNYSAATMPQPVVSYFWYMLQKAFERAGLQIDEYGKQYDAELSLVFTSLTDEEIRFSVRMVKLSQYGYQKDYVVTMAPTDSMDPKVLEQRAYGMVDAIVTTILNDPEFQKAFTT